MSGQAFDVPLADVRRVHMLTGDIGETAVRCRAGELTDTRITLFQPLRFMLASPVETPPEAFSRMQTSPVWTEEKYDGVRCQLHRSDGRCELFSRELKETAAAFPEIVEAGLRLDREVILDGEVLAHRGDRVLPFFDLQRRLGRKEVSARLRDEVPLVFVAFDLLYLDGDVVMDRPLAERRRLMEEIGLEWPFLLARLETAEGPEHPERIFARARSGFALRFPRIVRLRPDKPVAEIDTLARVEELYERYFGRSVPLAEVAEVSQD